MGFYRDFDGGRIEPGRDKWRSNSGFFPSFGDDSKPYRKKSNISIWKLLLLIICLSPIIYFITLNESQQTQLIQEFNTKFGNIQTPITPFFASLTEPIGLKTSEIEKQIFYLTNAERSKYGLKPLIWSDNLAIIAREHSGDMGVNNYFSHENLKGEGPTERAKKHGFPTEVQVDAYTTKIGIGENIGEMPTGSVEGMGFVADDANSIARAQVQSWMESPGHRQNILNPEYSYIGIGVAYVNVYYYSTQNFQ